MALSELNQAVRQRLDALSTSAYNGDNGPASEVARSEMPHLIEAVQRLIAEHDPSEHGGCPTCARILPAGKRLPRHPKAPCRVYLAARWALFGESAHQARPDVP